MNNRNSIIVTTGDLKRDYEVLGPVYFQVSNKGLFGSTLSSLKKQYSSEIQSMKQKGTMSADRADWGFLYGEWSVGQNDFDAAFFIATEELKKRAVMVGADAVICMRQDIDMDTNGFAFFYLQMYGTAVKFVNRDDADESPTSVLSDIKIELEQLRQDNLKYKESFVQQVTSQSQGKHRAGNQPEIVNLIPSDSHEQNEAQQRLKGQVEDAENQITNDINEAEVIQFLKDYKELFDAGILSPEEYNNNKTRLLQSLDLDAKTYSEVEVIKHLKDFKELLDKSIISPEDFEIIKKQLIGYKEQKHLEEQRRKEEEQKWLEEERRKEEEQRRLEEQRRKEEEQKRLEEQRNKEEEQKRLEEQRRKEEEQRQLEEQRRKEEEQRQIEEQRRKEEEQKRLEEQRNKEEEQRRIEEQRKKEEKQKRLEEQRQREAEKKRIKEQRWKDSTGFKYSPKDANVDGKYVCRVCRIKTSFYHDTCPY